MAFSRVQLQDLLIGGLIALAALYFAWPVWRATLLLEIDGNEAWNAFQIGRLRAGLPLYPERNALISNNYPPLSFLIIDKLGMLGISPVKAGRALSLLAIIAGAVAIGAIVRHFTPSWRAAAVGAVWFVATVARFFEVYAGSNDPNLPALALMLWGVAGALHAEKRGRSVLPAFALMVLAGFYKHNLITFPLVTAIWIARTSWLRAAVPLGFAVLLALAGLAICTAVYGWTFPEQLTLPRVTRLSRPYEGGGRLQFIAPALVIWALTAWCSRRESWAQFTATFVAVGFVEHLMLQIGDGVDDNSQFALTAATAVGLGLAFEFIAGNGLWRNARITLLLVVISRLLLSDRTEPYRLFASPEFRDVALGLHDIATNEVARIAAMPGLVVCSIRSVCFHAGKPFVFDHFYVRQKLALGLLSPAELDSAIAAQGIQFANIDAAASTTRLRDRPR